MKKKIIIRGGLLLSVLLALLLGYGEFIKTYTPPFSKGENPKAIAFFGKVKLGGVEQQILIRGKDVSKPVIIFLHGGPGTPDMSMVRYYNSELEDRFVVVTWDQRGCGKSYDEKVFDNHFMLDQFVSDSKDLVDYVKEVLNKEKVYLIGHSWGTILGMKLIKEYPEDFFAYLSVSQVVDLSVSEGDSYDFVKEQVEKNGGEELKKELAEIARPINGKYPGGIASMIKQRDLLLKLGGVLKGHTDYTLMIDAMMASTENNYPDFMTLEDAFSKTVKHLWSELLQVNMREEVLEVQVPVYFVYGVDDKILSPALIKDYSKSFVAPVKKVIPFDNCGHFPQIEDNKRFNELVISLWTVD